MKKFTLLLAGMLCASASFATNYYVSVQGAGSKDGSSWENAIDFATMYANINNYANGDVFYFEGGKYVVPQTVTTISNGYSFIGSATDTPTVFSGDVNGDETVNAGDANGILSINTATKNGDKSKHFVLQGITFTGAYVSSEGNAGLKIDNSGWVDVKDCIFDGNVSTVTSNNGGGAGCWAYRSMVYFTGCKFVNNTAAVRGGAVKLTSNSGEKGYTTFDGCYFSNNSANELGSAIHLNQGVQLDIINSTIEGNKSDSDSKNEKCAVFVIGADNTYARLVTIVNSTIAGNTGDAQLAGRDKANIRIANSIIVGDGENTAITLTGTPKQVLSAGYNIIGKYSASVTPSWKTSDLVADANTQSSIFGDNAVKNGPAAAPYGASAGQLSAAVADWNVTQDLTVDMNGTSRGDISVPGAVVAEPLKGVIEMTDAKYATLYQDFGWVMPNNLKGAVVTSANTGGTLTVDYKYNGGTVVPAQSALLLNGEAGNYEAALKLEESTTDQNLLQGTSENATTTSDDANAKFYKLSDGSQGIGFYYGAENGAAFTNEAHRAYLVVSSAVNAPKAFSLADSVTGINSLHTDSIADAAVYNLRGIKMGTSENLPKGVYIKNGKKFIVK